METNDQERIQQQIAMIENEAKKHLDSNALARYSNMRIAHSEKALQVAALIVQASQTGQLQGVLNDSQFRGLLVRLQEPNKEFKITRK